MLRTLARRARPLANYALQLSCAGVARSVSLQPGHARWLEGVHGDHAIRHGSSSQQICRLLSTTAPPTDYGAPVSAEGEAEEEIERLPLPPGVSGDKFGLYELEGTSKDWGEVSGENAVVGVHGPEELWTPAPGNPGASGGIFAVIAAGGTQNKVCRDDVLYLNRIEGDVNEEMTFNDVLLVGAYDWSVFGRPLIRGASVTGTIEEQTLSGKVLVTKFKKRKGYLRRKGHRQPITRVRINEVRFEFPGEEEIRPYEVRYDPRKPPMKNHSRWFF